MGASHHGYKPDPEQDKRLGEIIDRFNQQVEGRAKRAYSQGRVNAHDDGDLAMAITADKAKNLVIIDFGKPVEWIGMGPAECNGLINLLMKQLRELGVPATISV